MTRKVAIIGGGLSVKECNLNRLNRTNGFFIAVNDAWRGFKAPNFVFSIDTMKLNDRFDDCPYEIILAAPEGFGTPAAKKECDHKPYNHLRMKKILRLEEPDGFSFQPNAVNGGHSSGYGALNYALTHLNPEFVFLFGYDYVDMAKHWHEHKDERQPDIGNQGAMIDAFGYLPADMFLNRVILNCSSISNLKQFPQVSPSEGIKIWNSIR